MRELERGQRSGLLSVAAHQGHSFLFGAVLWLFSVALAVLIIAALSAFTWTDRISRSEALHIGQESVAAIGRGTVGPLITDELVRGDLAAYQAMDAAMRARISHRSISQVLLWDNTGRIIYSDDPELVGRRFALEDADLQTLLVGGTSAELQTAPASRHAFEQGVEGALLEVYAGVQGRNGEQYLLEAYLHESQVKEARGRLLGRLLPGLVIVLAVATLLQLPLAIFLARRSQRAQSERNRLEDEAKDASAAERRKLAQSLHDDVLQDLAGLGYALSATAALPEARVRADTHSILGTADTIVRRSVLRLRQILADMYELQAAETDLADVIATLSKPLQEQGVTVVSQIDGSWVSLRSRERAVILRVLRESLRNVSRHAEATRVVVRVLCDQENVKLVVSDDGVGFDSGLLDTPVSGHVGLCLSRDAVREAGGVLWVESRRGDGCQIHVVLPLSEASTEPDYVSPVGAAVNPRRENHQEHS